jgi:hypothetical protein
MPQATLFVKAGVQKICLSAVALAVCSSAIHICANSSCCSALAQVATMTPPPPDSSLLHLLQATLGTTARSRV